MKLILKYLLLLRIDKETSYPYKGRQQKKCNYKQSEIGADDKGMPMYNSQIKYLKYTGFTDLPAGDEDALKV